MPPADLGYPQQSQSELELKLVQSPMAQKPVLGGEVGTRSRRVCGQTRGEVWASRHLAAMYQLASIMAVDI